MSKLLIYIVGMIATICVIFSVISISSVRNIINQYVINKLDDRALDASKIVEQQINTYIAKVSDIASRNDIKSMDWSIQQQILIDEAKRIGFERFQIIVMLKMQKMILL